MTDPVSTKRSSDLQLASEIAATDDIIMGRSGQFWRAKFAKFLSFVIQQMGTGVGTTATSHTNLTITNNANRTFLDVELDRAFAPGMRLRAADVANPTTKWMEGVVLSYAGTQLIVAMDKSLGAGAVVSWSIGVAGQFGADGLGTGDTSSNTATSVDGEAVLFSGTTGKLVKRDALTASIVKSAAGIKSAAAAADIDATYALGNWKADYLNGTSVRTAIALGADKTLYASNGAAVAPSFRTLANLGIVEGGVTFALTAGYTSASVSAGTKTTGTYTFDPTAGSVQHVTNGGAHTFAPPATHGAWQLDYINNGSAGALTTSGWTKVDGDSFDTVNTHAFRCMMSVGNQGSYLSVKRVV